MDSHCTYWTAEMHSGRFPSLSGTRLCTEMATYIQNGTCVVEAIGRCEM